MTETCPSQHYSWERVLPGFHFYFRLVDNHNPSSDEGLSEPLYDSTNPNSTELRPGIGKLNRGDVKRPRVYFETAQTSNNLIVVGRINEGFWNPLFQKLSLSESFVNSKAIESRSIQVPINSCVFVLFSSLVRLRLKFRFQRASS